MKRLVALILLFLVASACWGAKSVNREKAEDDIREAVFRYQFTDSSWCKPAQVYFLSVNNNDPGKAVIKRFQGHRPEVKPLSKCRIDKVWVRGRLPESVMDRETGGRGLIFKASAIKWLNSSKVEVVGGYFADGLNSSRSTYTIELEKGHWGVTRDKGQWTARSGDVYQRGMSKSKSKIND